MSRHRSYGDRLFVFCLSALAAAIALYVAVRLLLAVWLVLLAITAAISCLSIAIYALRRHANRW
jgi:hypothetical protein